jgi:rare lipoprotein A
MTARLAALLLVFALLPLDGALAEGMEPSQTLASWYGARHRGRPTASGERFAPKALTAAHPTLPFGTLVEVQRLGDRRKVLVRINDRGPARGDGIDLSEAAARAIGLIGAGSAWVTLSPVAVIASR